MVLSPLHADARANAHEAARVTQLERRLARFQPLVQPRVRALAERHTRLKDLALSFPALLFALAVPRPGLDPARAIARVIDGAPLRELAEVARVPLWLRPIQPAAFKHALPELPDGDIFRRQISNYLPTDPRQFASWSAAVAEAGQMADQAVALWLARELHHARGKLRLQMLRGLCLWTWYSRHCRADTDVARPAAWTPAMGYDRAVGLAAQWLRTADLHLNLGREALADIWLTPAQIDGYDFVPLRTAADIAEEAVAMRHCVAEYGSYVRHDECRLWSMRRDGARIATIEIASRTNGPLPGIEQLKTASNGSASTEVWLVARRWLNSHDPLSIMRTARAWDTVPLDAKLWTKLWRPYWLAKRRIPDWLPLQPSRSAMSVLCYGERPVRPARRRRRR